MIVIMRGISGSGKTRLANYFFKSHEIISSDEIRMEMYGTMDIDPNASAGIWSVFYDRIEHKAKYKMAACIDSTNLTTRNFKKIESLLNRWGADYRIVSIVPDLEDCLRTMASRRSGDIRGANVPDDVVKGQLERFNQNTDHFYDSYGEIFFHGTASECYSFIQTYIGSINQFKVNDCYVIGDIHGMIHHLEELLKKIPDGVSIASVGDVIDRGPDSFGCLRMLHSDPRFIGMAMGNHEHAFMREIITGSECRSKARRKTHDEYWTLSKKNRKLAMDIMKSAYSFMQVRTEYDTAIITHAGVGALRRDTLNLHHTYGDRVSPVSEYYGTFKQVHGHASWNYSGDFSGLVANIDSGCYQTGILTAFSPFTGDVIRVEIPV